MLKTEKIDFNILRYFKEKCKKEEYFFNDIELPEKQVALIKKFLLATIVNFVNALFAGYDVNKPYDIQDSGCWDEYFGLILRLKVQKLTEVESKEILRMIPLAIGIRTLLYYYFRGLIFLLLSFYIMNKLI